MNTLGLSLWHKRLAHALLTTLILLMAAPSAVAGRIVSPADLLSPESFPDASFGMKVESATDGPSARIITTGAEFIIDKTAGTVECRQRIARQWTVATLTLPPQSLGQLRLSHQSSGAAIFTGGGTTVRINGDSLLMVSPSQGGTIQATLGFRPDCHFASEGSHDFFDPDGGISFFDHGHSPLPELKLEKDPVQVSWPWNANDVFWAAVSPPRPFDWQASINQRMAWSGGSFQPYPTDADIAALARHATILHIHSEIMLWKRWQSDLTPRDPAQIRRVIATAHRHGMRVIVYTTPAFFLKGTPRQHEEVTEVGDGSMNHVVGWGQADNEQLYLAEITRVLTKEMPELDGLYMDGMYTAPDQQAAAYHLARSARQLAGDGRILILHASGAIGGTRTTCPAADTYYNMVLRGEGEETNVEPAYLRYFLSGYNVNNSIGVLVHFTLTLDQIDKVLRANARLPLPLRGPELIQAYLPRLSPSLQEQISADLARRTGVFEQNLARSKAIRQHLAEERKKGKDLEPEAFLVPGLKFRGGYWRFEEPCGLQVFDSLTPQHNGELWGGVTRAADSFAATIPQLGIPNRGCLSFDGQVGSYVSIPLDPSGDVGSQPFAIEAWIRPRTVSSRPTMVAGKAVSGISNPPDTGYVLDLIPQRTPAGQPRYLVRFSVCDSHGRRGQPAEVTSGEFELNQWHRISGVRRPTQIELYVDGKLIGTDPLPGPEDFSSDQPFTIGAAHAGKKGSYPLNFDGLIDEVRLSIGTVPEAP